MSWFRGESPGDPRPEILVGASLGALLLLVLLWDFGALVSGVRTVARDDVVDGWEPSFFGTVAILAFEAFLALLLVALRFGAANSTRRVARWALLIVAAGAVVAVLGHAIVSERVWGYLKLF